MAIITLIWTGRASSPIQLDTTLRGCQERGEKLTNKRRKEEKQDKDQENSRHKQNPVQTDYGKEQSSMKRHLVVRWAGKKGGIPYTLGGTKHMLRSPHKKSLGGKKGEEI